MHCGAQHPEGQALGRDARASSAGAAPGSGRRSGWCRSRPAPRTRPAPCSPDRSRRGRRAPCAGPASAGRSAPGGAAGCSPWSPPMRPGGRSAGSSLSPPAQSPFGDAGERAPRLRGLGRRRSAPGGALRRRSPSGAPPNSCAAQRLGLQPLRWPERPPAPVRRQPQVDAEVRLAAGTRRCP